MVLGSMLRCVTRGIFRYDGGAFRTLVPLFVLLVQLAFLAGETPSFAKEGYFDMSLEQLMKVEVTSASKHEQSLTDTAAAVFVITQDDLRRSGVLTIPEALRMVPGVQVSRINADNWAVSIRGFNGEFANKLLVLIDGRSIYSPVSSGVYWDEHNIPIDEIERIEVIRGPGGSLWGENAVNGIINIITKKAKETQGLMISTGVGNENEALVSARYGGRVGDNTFFRLYAKGIKGDSSKWRWDGSAHDDCNHIRGGFRVDSKLGERDSVTFSGDLHRGNRKKDYYAPTFSFPYAEELRYTSLVNTGDLLARWRHGLSNGGEMVLRGYFWGEGRQYENYSFVSNTLDLDGRVRIPLRNHLITLGAEYRHVWTHFWNTYQVGFFPGKRRDHFYSLYFQDEVSLSSRLKLVVGSRFSHNPFSDWEVQPTARLLWHMSDKNTLWMAVSRAVRTPDFGRHSISYLYAVIPPKGEGRSLPLAVVGEGNRHLDSESVVSYEMGTRTVFSPRFNVSTAVYFNRYRKLLNTTKSVFSGLNTDTTPHLEAISSFDNIGYGESYGFEASANIEVTPWWRLQGAFTFGRMFVHYSHRLFEKLAPEDQEEGRMPRHQLSLRSSMDLSSSLSLNTWLRYVDNLWRNGVPSYVAFDATVIWRPAKQIEVSLSGFNLFDNRHAEFNPNLTDQNVSEVERSFFGKITLRF